MTMWREPADVDVDKLVHKLHKIVYTSCPPFTRGYGNIFIHSYCFESGDFCQRGK